MNVNKEEVLKRIDGMDVLCSRGRRQVVALVESIIGEPLVPERRLFCGELIEDTCGKSKAVLIKHFGDQWTLVALDGSTGPKWEAYWNGQNQSIYTEEELRTYLPSRGWKRTGKVA